MVDMTVFFTVWLSKKEDLLAAALITDNQKQSKVVFAGPFPSWKPQLFLQNDNYLVIRGEPEETFKGLLEKLSKDEKYLHELNGLSFLNQIDFPVAFRTKTVCL